MTGRAFQRVPYTVRVEFRTASSFLVAYSVNLSRGGIFLETDHDAAVGDSITLEFTVPGLGPIKAMGRVAWRREPGNKEGPSGLGVKFERIEDELGQVIDKLITGFERLQVLVLCAREQDGPLLARLVRSVLGTADITSSSDFRQASALLTGSTDLAIIEVDIYTDIGLDLIRQAKARTPSIPVIALASHQRLQSQARMAGADEFTPNPPPVQSFQTLLVRALGRPLRVAKPPPRLPGVSS
ncbi:MAG: hypothetical protein Tsb0020_48560 [Haliangiales bacterium]